MKNKLKTGFLLSFFLLTAFLSVTPSYALSTEVTSVEVASLERNQGKYVHIGSYHVFALDQKLLFFDSDAALVKTYDVPMTSPVGSSTTDIMAFNTTHLIIGSTYKRTVARTYVLAGFLEVETLTWTELYHNYPISVAPAGNDGDSMLIYNNGAYYVLTGHYATTLTNSSLMEIYPTQSVLWTDDTKILFNSSSLWIPSETINVVYVVAKNGETTTRFTVYKIDLVTPTVTVIGTSGIDNTWGQNVYFVGYSYDTDGTSSWYDVGVVYNNPAVNKDIYPQICRFNDTYVTYIRSTVSVSSAVNTVRCMSAPYTGTRTDITELIEGEYHFVYVGESYAMMQCPFTIDDLNTVTPTIDTDTVEVYQNVNHYYNLSSTVGGYQPETTGVVLMVDFGGNVIADLWTAGNPELTYSYTVIPDPVSYQGTYDFTIIQNFVYVYTGQIYVDGVEAGFGYASIYYKTEAAGTWTLLKNVGILEGYLVFDFQISVPFIWWELNMTFVTSAIGNDTRTMTIDHDIIALSGSYASPTPTSSDSGYEPAITGGVQFALAFLIPMLFILGPALILGVKIGMPGFMGGLMVGFGVWSLINPIAIAVLVAVIFASIIMLMYGRGKATGE